MDWKNIFCFGSYILFFTVLVIGTGHPIRNHGKKSHHFLARKAKINKRVQRTPNQNKEKKSSFLNAQLNARAGSTEDAKKKGTIRILGPWQSESGLDRNVDPMEDSYVKKIISSNEGLNFNKDIAEAGEVFDVNGIDDFYDKNALITYEVNGHEIPVHLKQKLTPQSQMMFPEYGHDSQPSDTSSRDGHSYKQRNPNEHKVTTFFGMSLKDMPEYKVQDTPSVGEKQQNMVHFSERARMSGPHFEHEDAYSRHSFANSDRQNSFDSSVIMPSAHQDDHREGQSQFDRIASEYEQANEVGQEDANFGSQTHNLDRANSETDIHRSRRPFDSSVSGFETHSYLDRFSSKMNPERDPLDNDENGQIKEFAMHKGINDREALLEEISRLKEHTNHPIFPNPSHSEHFYHKRPSDSVQFSDRPKPALINKPMDGPFRSQGVKNFFNVPESIDDHLQGESRGVGKDFDGGKLAPAAAEGDKNTPEEKTEDSNKFFEQLEKIDQERQKNEEGRQEFLPGKSLEINSSLPDLADKVQRYSDDNERNKAKDKLLKILGDLTSKLKGMEAAVKDTHTDERRESPSVSDIQDAKQEAVEPKKEGKDNDESRYKDQSTQEKSSKQEQSKQEPPKESEAVTDNGKGSMDNTHKYPWESNQYSHSDSSSHETDHSDAYTSYGHHPSESERNEANQEHLSHLINNLKQHDQPFIFNTEEIDYKRPSYEGKFSDGIDETSQDKDEVHPYKFDHGGHLVERPIMSSFYHELDRNNEFDTHAFHPESDLSSNNEVTPTQRDGGRNEKEEMTHKDESASEKKPTEYNEVKQYKEKETKSDPDDDLPDYNEVKDAAIFEENFIRKKYHSPSLRWSDDLSDEAQKEADDLSEEKALDLNKKNIPKGMNAALVPLTSLNVGKDSADLWKKEATKFDFVSPIISKKNSDFAQMVWKTAKEFGLGVAKSRDKENWIVVAKYDTPAISEYEKLKANIESDIPVADPYSDIARRGRISKVKKYLD